MAEEFISAIDAAMPARERIAIAIWEGRPGHHMSWSHLSDERRLTYLQEADYILWAADPDLP